MKPYVKILSVVFCLLILVGALPFTASAYEGEIDAICEISSVATDDKATYDEATYDEATYDEATCDEICYATIDEIYYATYCSGGVSIPKDVNSFGSASDNHVAVITGNDKLHPENTTEKAKHKDTKSVDTFVSDKNTPKSDNGDTKTLKVQSAPIFGNMLLWIISGSVLCILGAGAVYFAFKKRRKFKG